MGGYEEVTRSYVDFLGGLTAGGYEEGMAVLWCMEHVSLGCAHHTLFWQSSLLPSLCTSGRVLAEDS